MERDFIINSATQCCTYNYFDKGKRYYFFIENGSLFYQREGDPIKPIADPFVQCSIERVAVDNNRLIILTKNIDTGEKKLYWCCIIEDISAWVKYIFTLANILTSNDQTIKANDNNLSDADKLIKYLLNNTNIIKNLLANGLAFFIEFMKLDIDIDANKQKIIDVFNTIEKEQDMAVKKHNIKVLFNDLFTLFLKNTYNGQIRFQNDSFSAFDEWAKKYSQWVKESHHPFVWNEIKRTGVKVPNVNLFRKASEVDQQTENLDFELNYNDILDIAVGNWHQTVTTFYLLLPIDKELFKKIFKDISNKELSTIKRPSVILYIDEEPIMHNWKIVPGKINTPYPLSGNSRINAAHSVISVTKKENNENKIFWIRYDYHNFEDFAWFPLNWTETYFSENSDKMFDVDTIRLHLNNLGPDKNTRFINDVLLPNIFNFLKNDPKNNTNKFAEDMIALFKEDRIYHPGWHVIDNPTKDSDELHIKVTTDNPRPVPYINQFMMLLLNLSKLYEIKSEQTKRLPINIEFIEYIQYAEYIDTIAEMLEMLYSTARTKTQEKNRLDDIIQNLGFLGENPIIPSYNYPVRFTVKEKQDTYKIFTIPSAQDTHLINWQDIYTTKKYTLKACNNKFISTRTDKDNMLYANKSKKEKTTQFTAIQLDYDLCALRAHNDDYIGIKNTNRAYLVAGYKNPGTWESLKIIPREIAIQAGNGSYIYITVKSPKVDKVLAGKNEITKESTFRLHYTRKNTVTIRSVLSDKFLAAFGGLENEITTTSETTLHLTQFTLIRLGLGRWALQTIKGHYLSVENDKKESIVTVQEKIGENELFKIIPIKVALQTTGNQYIRKAVFRNYLTVDRMFNWRYSLFQLTPL